MADEVRDALMKLKINGTTVLGEGTAKILTEELSEGFQPGTQNNKWQGNFFAVTDFRIDIGLLADTENDPAAIARQEEERKRQLLEAIKEKLENPDLIATRGAADFGRFMNMPPSGAMRSYSSNLEPVVFTKQLDMTSLTLFDTCVKSTTIDSASLIKRRGSGQAGLSTYLRIDFTDLLITDINWDEDDVITEKITFICRKAEIRYRVETHSGALGPVLPAQSWSMLNLK